MEHMKETLRGNVCAICKMYENGMDVDSIVDSMFAQMFADPVQPAAQPAPGWVGMIGDTMPTGVLPQDILQVVYRDGSERMTIRADLVQWHSVQGWRLETAVYPDPASYAPHTGGDSIPVAPTARVDAKFFGSRTRYGVLADDVDWGNVTSYRVLQP
jgi:hypothetical protein